MTFPFSHRKAMCELVLKTISGRTGAPSVTLIVPDESSCRLAMSPHQCFFLSTREDIVDELMQSKCFRFRQSFPSDATVGGADRAAFDEAWGEVFVVRLP